MRSIALCLIAAAALFAAVSPAAAMPIKSMLPGWGRDGHDVTAALAQLMLTQKATEQCATLLPSNDGQLIQIANWADEVKSKPAYRWSAPLHFINTPDWSCDYIRSRDCQLNGVPNFCVDGAIQNYTKRVNDGNLGFDQQAEALKFIVHFIGDVHQPLHCANTGDKGGNTITGTFLGQTYNLHAVWDEGIIIQRMTADFNGNQTAWMESLAQRINTTWAGQVPAWLKCADNSPIGACSEEWANESVTDACKYAYVEADGVTRITTPFDLENDYYTRNLPIVELRIAQAGVRMAHVLNSLFV